MDDENSLNDLERALEDALHEVPEEDAANEEEDPC
jgi:hypothetical protein